MKMHWYIGFSVRINIMIISCSYSHVLSHTCTLSETRCSFPLLSQTLSLILLLNSELTVSSHTLKVHWSLIFCSQPPMFHPPPPMSSPLTTDTLPTATSATINTLPIDGPLTSNVQSSTKFLIPPCIDILPTSTDVPPSTDILSTINIPVLVTTKFLKLSVPQILHLPQIIFLMLNLPPILLPLWFRPLLMFPL